VHGENIGLAFGKYVKREYIEDGTGKVAFKF